MVVVPFPSPTHSGVGNRAAATRLFDHLDSGERLLWADQPAPWSMVRDRGFMVPLWIAAIAAPLGLILTFAHGGGLIHVAGLCLIGGAVVIGLIALAIWHRAGDMVYGLTDRRVLVLHDGAMPKLDATRADRIAWIDVIRQRDDTGAVALTIVDGTPAGRELVLGGLSDPQDVARRVATAYHFHAPHLLQG